MRPKALINLLNSVKEQLLYPNEILIIDGSTNNETALILKQYKFENLKYFKVKEKDRGLTKQRNFGINLINKTSDVVCFLDDDTVLKPSYFKSIINTFSNNPDVTGIGGVALNENRWLEKKVDKVYDKTNYYEFENYVIKESLRNKIRNIFKLQSPDLPGVMPTFSNGRTYSYPLTGKIYKVDLLVGMSFSFKREVFENIKFSTYFEGYGLYEDADYSLRALQYGDNVIDTNAQLFHYHDNLGRPNKFKYGKMVMRNGWYVWRVKYPNPSFKARLKWHAIAFLLTSIRFTNVINTNNKKEAFTESLGRTIGWLSLLINKPKVKS